MNESTVITTPRQRQAVRDLFGCHNHVPVKVIRGGHLRPTKLGRRGGHFTRGGSPIMHPSAYSKRGWSNMIYRCSTQRIYVGELYLAGMGN